MAQIVVFGATGYAGGHIARELVSRGHAVLGVARTVPENGDGIEYVAGSIHDAELVRRVAHGADQIVVALHAHVDDGPQLAEALPLLAEVAQSEGARLSFVGGAGSLNVSEGGPRLFDTAEFPAEYKPEAVAHGAILDWLRTTDEKLDWFYVSPAAVFGSWVPGERTGTFRVGGDILLTDAEGNSSISGADYATAYVDEIEKAAHPRARLSVAY
ncbi:NAD(P)-dependent oxidoreductase [Microbacterium dextranolyticum]|uniref:NAD-dependent epimerase n=1 Tax=Microbacterium dextranolyticum TaxID=36806 RepID=A0A9W6M6B6_9MICO|nr:NAD(P)H-binding protein [Microbacterium dextranolyticum]MBM7462598.1 putative NADH-flavin reductase [Microbacterium dextranolyticum]GLJ96299.1 NAD-dependent epimerase [Microbacterium dextranolyticum]